MPRLAPTVFETNTVQTSEIIPVGVDFAADLAVSGEEIASQDVKVFDKAGVDKTSTVLKTNSIVDGKKTNSKSLAILHNFVDLERYRVEIKATVDANKLFEADVFVPVKDI